MDGPNGDLERAQALLDAGRPSDAAGHLRRALASDPRNAEAHCQLAVVHLKMEDWDEALRQAETGAACDPENEWPHRIRARARNELGRHPEAVAAAEEAVRRDPSEAYAHVVLAENSVDAGLLDQAEAAADRAVQLAPDNVAGHNALGLVAMGRSRCTEAEAHFREALRCQPDHPNALNNLGAALSGQGRRREAVHAFASASRADPHNSTSRRNATATAAIGGVGFAVFAVVGIIRPLLSSRAKDVPSGVAIPLAMALIVLSVVVFSFVLVRWLRARGDPHPKASRRMMRDLQRQWFVEWRERRDGRAGR